MLRAGSAEAAPTSLDLFNVPPSQAAIVKRGIVEYHPVATLDDHGPIEFDIPASETSYTDWNDHTLRLKVKITNGDGTALAADERVAFENYALHNLFSRVDVSINGKVISTPSETYPYKVVLEKDLSFKASAKTTQFQREIYAKNTPGNLELTVVDPANAHNSGFLERKKLTATSTEVHLRGQLHVDLFMQERLLPNRLAVRVKLSRSKPEFCLLGVVKAFKVKILEAVLETTSVELSPSILNQHNARLNRGERMKIPIRRTDTKVFNIPRGNLSVVKESIISGQLPKRCVVGFVETEAFQGKISKCFHNFKHFNLNHLALTVDNQQFPSPRAFTPDFANKDYLRCYESILTGTGIRGDNRSLEISLDSYAKGHTLYMFNLSPSEPDCFATDLIRNGSIRLEARFSEALAAPVTGILFCEYDSVIEIDRDRVPHLDY